MSSDRKLLFVARGRKKISRARAPQSGLCGNAWEHLVSHKDAGFHVVRLHRKTCTASRYQARRGRQSTTPCTPWFNRITARQSTILKGGGHRTARDGHWFPIWIVTVDNRWDEKAGLRTGCCRLPSYQRARSAKDKGDRQ